MSEKTLAEEIITIVKAHSNDNPAPETATIIKIYDDKHHADVLTNTQLISYVEVIGAPKLQTDGLLVYLNGTRTQPLLIATDYYTTTELDTKLTNKQDKLISGTNLKTINNTSILGSGNIDIQGGGGGGTINMVGAFSIDDNGHLIVELPDGYSNPYSINSSGHLIYNTSATEE